MLLSYGGMRIVLDEPTEFFFGNGQLQVPKTPLTLRTAALKGTQLEILGSMSNLGSKPEADRGRARESCCRSGVVELIAGQVDQR